MAALTANKDRMQKVHDRIVRIAAANAGDVYYVGAYIVREAATALCTPGSDTAGVRPLGVVVENMFPDDPSVVTAHLDNSSGADGVLNATTQDRVVRYDCRGEYAFAVSAGTPLPGAAAFLVDDDTVSAAATTNNVIAGWFTRPAPDGTWFVDISRAGVSPG